MLYFSKDDNCIQYQGADGSLRFVGLKALTTYSNSNLLIQNLIAYLLPMRPATVASTVHKVATVFSANNYHLNDIPDSSCKDAWSEFVVHLFSNFVEDEEIKSDIKTRIVDWNKTIVPFLEYLRDTRFIPSATVLNKLNIRNVFDEKSTKQKIIGDVDLRAFNSISSLNSEVAVDELISQVTETTDPTITTDRFLAELKFDLTTRLGKLEQTLENYWKNIQRHFKFGQAILGKYDSAEIQKCIETKSYYTVTISDTGRPQRRHVCHVDSERSFFNLLYVTNHLGAGFVTPTKAKYQHYPASTLSSQLANSRYFPFPSNVLEDETEIKIADKVNWCVGALNARDISFIIALLIIKCPNFNFESLLFSQSKNFQIKSFLRSSATKVEFSVVKHRTHSMKTAKLDDTSKQVIEFLLKTSERNEKYRKTEHQANSVFLALDNQKNHFAIPSKSKVIDWITSRSRTSGLYSFFPSLLDYGLGRGTFSYKSIRSSIAVLEWLNTGSIKMAAKKIGNSERVCIEHYLPDEIVDRAS